MPTVAPPRPRTLGEPPLPRALPAAPASGEFAVDRRRHLQAAAERLPAELDKPTRPLERLHGLRDRRLRALVRHAKAHSPWHARRLRHVDPARLRGDDLSMLPAMTKADLMANWDEIVTDRRLSLAGAERHIASVRDGGPAYWQDQYMALASGGSTGRHGVFAWDFEGVLSWALMMVPYLRWLDRHTPWGGGEREAQVVACHATHASAAVTQTFAPPGAAKAVFPLSLPIDEIVAGLNAYQPSQVNSYPSMLHRLAREARAGRLRIAPGRLVSLAEPLFPENRRAIEAAFGAPVVNVYAASEVGIIAWSYPGQAGLHLLEDIAVYEPVDRAGRAVPPGRRSDAMLVTNVVNQTLPLIRYELTDEVTLLDEPNPGPWTGRRIADPQGRLDDTFWYTDGVAVHPYAFWTALGTAADVAEYQVRQTPRGAEVSVLASGPFDAAAVARHLVDAYARLGLPDAEIRISAVPALERLPGTGKLRRFLPLPR